MHTRIKIKDSIAAKLLRIVFSFYLLVAITVTGVHLIVEYRDTRESVLNELKTLQKTFEPALAQALWDLNFATLKSTYQGMLELPNVIGVKVIDEQGTAIGMSGTVLNNASKIIEVNDGQNRVVEGYQGLFWHSFPIYYTQDNNRIKVGEAIIYSSDSVVFGRLQLGFLFIIINSVIKTIALWILFLWFGREYLTRPLGILTKKTRALNLDNLKVEQIDIGTTGENELKVLETSFNKMITKLHSARERLMKEIKERKEAQSKLAKINEKLERIVQERTAGLRAANQELQAFSYSVSHDLRAPLRRINGFSDILQQDFGTELSQDAVNLLNRINVGCRNMNQLIEDLLALSKVSTTELHLMQVNLSGIALELVDTLNEMGPDRKVNFDIKKDMKAICDLNFLRIVLENLLSNAWKYTKKTEGAKVTFGQVKDAKVTTFYVKDNGAGFDPAQAGKIFEAFQRLHSAQDFEGTGIGLATVERIIKRHKGNIWANAKVGKGATFYFSLPQDIHS